MHRLTQQTPHPFRYIGRNAVIRRQLPDTGRVDQLGNADIPPTDIGIVGHRRHDTLWQTVDVRVRTHWTNPLGGVSALYPRVISAKPSTIILAKVSAAG